MRIAVVTATLVASALTAGPRVTSYLGEQGFGSQWELEEAVDGGGCSAKVVVYPDGGCKLSSMTAQWDSSGVSDATDHRFYECGEPIALCSNASWLCDCSLRCREALAPKKSGCAMTVEGRVKSNVKCGASVKLCGLSTACECTNDAGP